MWQKGFVLVTGDFSLSRGKAIALLLWSRRNPIVSYNNRNKLKPIQVLFKVFGCRPLHIDLVNQTAITSNRNHK